MKQLISDIFIEKLTKRTNGPLKQIKLLPKNSTRFPMQHLGNSVTRLGDLLDFGQLYKAFGNN